ncbi:hypothetical protein D9M69_417460 [compost metagenome]
MLVRLQRDHGEVFPTRAMPLHVFARRAGEDLLRQPTAGKLPAALQGLQLGSEGTVQIQRHALRLACFQPLEADHQRAFGAAGLDHLAGQMERRGTAAATDGAKVGEARQVHALHSAAAGDMTAGEAGIGGPDLRRIDAGIGDRQMSGLGGHLRKARTIPRAAEPGDAHPQHVDATFHSTSPQTFDRTTLGTRQSKRTTRKGGIPRAAGDLHSENLVTRPHRRRMKPGPPTSAPNRKHLADCHLS